jgi:chromosome segregation ATPase
MSEYKLVNDQFKDKWINKPNNLGDVGDLQDITEELNNLLRERDEAREKAASWIREWRELRELWRTLDRAVNNLMRERDEAQERECAAIESWWEEHQRYLRLAQRVVEAREQNAKLISIADMARAKLTALRTHQDRSIRELVSKEHAVNSLLRQLDEAREQNAKLREIAERAINYLDQSYRDGFCDEASDLRAELNQLKEGTK